MRPYCDSRVKIVIADHNDLPDAAFDLMRVAFPDDKVDQRAFWDAHSESVHALVYDGDGLVAHAGCVERTLYVASRAITTAYVEYVAAEPRRHGFGSAAMRALQPEIAHRGFLLAALATGSPAFYERLGWKLWRGPAAYRAPDGTVVPTPDETPMVLDLGANVNLDDPIECDWRPVGDIW